MASKICTARNSGCRRRKTSSRIEGYWQSVIAYSRSKTPSHRSPPPAIRGTDLQLRRAPQSATVHFHIRGRAQTLRCVRLTTPAPLGANIDGFAGNMRGIFVRQYPAARFFLGTVFGDRFREKFGLPLRAALAGIQIQFHTALTSCLERGVQPFPQVMLEPIGAGLGLRRGWFGEQTKKRSNTVERFRAR